jgi:hypothetical protein
VDSDDPQEDVYETLPDDALVVRGGVMEPRVMQVGAETHYEDCGEFAISVASLPDASIEDITRMALLANNQIRVSTVGRIRACGYEVVPSEPPPAHADLKLPNPPTDDDWETLRSIFDDPIPNPHPRPKVRSNDG